MNTLMPCMNIVVGPIPSAGAHATLAQAQRFVRYFKSLVEKELKYYIDFATDTSPNVWWYDGDRIVFRSDSSTLLLHAMQQRPDITIEDLCKEAGIVPAAVKKQLKRSEEASCRERV